MGSFVLEHPETSKRYFAKLNETLHPVVTKIALSKVHSNGYALSVLEKGSRLFVKGVHTSKTVKSVILKGVCRGYTYINNEASLIHGQYIYSIPKQVLPDGIIAFKLFDSAMQPIADRLYFNSRQDGRITVNAHLEKAKYEQREKIELAIRTTGFDFVPIVVHASILGVQLLGKNALLNSKDHIVSFFLLSSVLKGSIENPNYYFEPQHIKELDYLMLTQG